MNKSENYECFKFLDYNRNLNRMQINKLKKSITQNGYLVSNPIIVDKDMNIIDGQHRFTACKEMGLPIMYEVITGNDNLIIDLNTTQKKWSTDDYVNYYSYKGNPNYHRIRTLKNKCQLTYDLILTIANQKITSGNTTQDIRNGKLKFTLDDTIRTQNMLQLIKEVNDNLRFNLTSRFAAAVIDVSKLKNFRWERLLKQSKEYSTVAYRCRTKEEYIDMLKNLYNYQSRKDTVRI